MLPTFNVMFFMFISVQNMAHYRSNDGINLKSNILILLTVLMLIFAQNLKNKI